MQWWKNEKVWEKQIEKGSANFDDNPGSDTFICTNHFTDWKPTSTTVPPKAAITSE